MKLMSIRSVLAIGEHDGQQKSDFQDNEHRVHRNVPISNLSTI